MLPVFETADFNNQLGRTLGRVCSRAACLGECIAVARRIVDGDTGSWLHAWRALADDLAATAEDGDAAGHRASAAECRWRAAEYYRQATFFHRVDLDDPDLQSGWRRARDCFLAGAAGLGMDVTPVDIPFEGTSLGGYVLRAESAGAAPLIVAPSGYDGTAEETAVMVAPAALRRGYDVLCFDGPGQGATLYDPGRRLFMRPDWENVLPAVVDFALGLPGVDGRRLVAFGCSFAGYLVPRGVSGEPRFAAMVADPGQYDIGRALKARLPAPLLARLDEDGPDATAAFDRLLVDPEGRLLFAPRMAAHGTATVQAYLRDCMRFSLEGRAGAIRCPSLICDNETDPVSTGQGALLAAAVSGPVESVTFTAAQGAAGHCEGVGREVFDRVAFDWLDRTLGAPDC